MSVSALDVVKALSKIGLNGISLEYDEGKDILLFNLNTMAKSGLRLSEDFYVYGRYEYSAKINNNQELEEIIKDLFWEFRNCLCGRDYYNSEWMEIGVQLGLTEKKVTTHTTTEYI